MRGTVPPSFPWLGAKALGPCRPRASYQPRDPARSFVGCKYLSSFQIRNLPFGEAVILGIDGASDFDALFAGRHNDEVQLAEGGADLEQRA